MVLRLVGQLCAPALSAALSPLFLFSPPPRALRAGIRRMGATGRSALLLTLLFALFGGAARAQTVTALSLLPPGVTGGDVSMGTVTLSAAPASNITVNLSTTNGAAGVGTSLTVYAGQTQGTFYIFTSAVASQTSGVVTASYNGTSQSQTLTVYPPSLRDHSFTISPNPVAGGQNATATILLDGPAPAGGLSVHLTTSNVQFVGLGSGDGWGTIQMLPQDVTIPAGQQSLSIPLATAWANYTQSATVTASLGQQSQTATLTLLGANLHLTDVLGPATLRLKWDNVPTNGQYLLTRDGAAIATLPAGTTSYDDVFAGGFASGQFYLYQLFDTSLPQTGNSQLSSEKVAAWAIPAGAAQCVDSRLDLRYSDVHYLDHCFGAGTYRGGLFAGMASDPSRVGRSFARVSVPPPPSGSAFFRAGGMTAFCTGLAGNTVTTAAIGCQIIPENTWDFPNLVWTATNPASFAASAAQGTTTISYDPANPTPQWVSWGLPDAIRGALASAAASGAPAPLTAAWAAADETAPGWAYFARGGAQGPQAAYALAKPVPVAAYYLPLSAGPGNAYYINVILNGLNPGDSATVTLGTGVGNNSNSAVVSGLNHVIGPYYLPMNVYYASMTVTCNGVTVMTQAVQGGGPQPGGGGPVFGGGGASD